MTEGLDLVPIILSSAGAGAVSTTVTVAVLRVHIKYLSDFVEMMRIEIKELKEAHNRRIIELEKKVFN